MSVKQVVQVVADDDFSLPTGLTKPTDNMQSCILYGLPKSGKTTALAKLPNCLIIDTENGTDKVSALVKKVPLEKGPVGRMQWLDKFADVIKGKYDYVAIDTFSEVNDWAEWSGTWRYMNSVQGQKFNRKDGVKGGDMLKPSDDSYESVHTIPEGYGYRWSREDTLRIFDKYMRVANKCVFFICHVEDKYVGQKENVDVIVPKQLALTGKLRNILPRKADAVGYVYNDDGEIKVNFTGSEERVGGIRCKHLQGYNGPLDWGKIFV